MDLREKIDAICAQKNLNQKQFAEALELNHIVLNRNLRLNKVTPDLIEGFVKNMPEIDLNWLLKEDGINMVNEDQEKYVSYNVQKKKLAEAIEILNEVYKKM